MSADSGVVYRSSTPDPVAGCEEVAVVACVVTFNPGPEFADNLRAVRAQVEFVLVVDNGSVEQDAIRCLTLDNGCLFVGNVLNMGIATALNQGARWAERIGACWLLTLDQDSRVGPGSVKSMGHFIQNEKFPGPVGIVAMTHRDRVTGTHYHHRLDILRELPSYRLLRAVITSGSMMRVSLFQIAGYFDESLFIDSVDHEYCLRIRQRGWLVVECRSQVLEHAIGAAVTYSVLGARLVATHHAPARRYYMTRNQLEMARRYWRSDPVWSLKAIVHLGVIVLSIALCERGVREKLSAMAKGVLHFMSRRFGPMT